MAARRGPKLGGSVKRTLIQIAPNIQGEAGDLLVSGVVENLSILQRMARLGYVTVEEHYVPVSLIFRKVGKMEIPVYPEEAVKEPDKLKLVAKIKKHHPPDAKALEYLINRVMGRPTEEMLNVELPDEFEFVLDVTSGASRVEEKKVLDKHQQEELPQLTQSKEMIEAE